MVSLLELTGNVRQLAENCALLSHEGTLLRLALDPRPNHLRTPSQEEKLAQALTRHFGKPMRIEIEVAAAAGGTLAQAQQRAEGAEIDEARASIDADPTVRALKERFGATVQPETVRKRTP